MSKLKVKYRENQIVVHCRLNRTEVLDEQQLNIMQSRIIRGIMKPVLKSSRKFSYIAPDGIPLKKYLSHNISKNDFLLLFAQILETVKSIEENSLNINNLIGDINYSFVTKESNEVFLLYHPVNSLSGALNLADFLYSIVYSVYICDTDINQLLSFLRTDNFQFNDLYAFVRNLLNNTMKYEKGNESDLSVDYPAYPLDVTVPLDMDYERTDLSGDCPFETKPLLDDDVMETTLLETEEEEVAETMLLDSDLDESSCDTDEVVIKKLDLL